MMTRFIVGLVLVAALATVGRAAVAAEDSDGPPDLPQAASAASTLQAAPDTDLSLGRFVVRLEKTTLKEVVALIRAGTIKHKGDAGDSETWLCYSASRKIRVWLVSGELGGAERAVTSLHVVGNSGGAGVIGCPALPMQARPAAFGNMIWLGSSAAQLKSKMGVPSVQESGWWVYSYSGRSLVRGLDELTIFGAHVRQGRVDQLFASKATTN